MNKIPKCSMKEWCKTKLAGEIPSCKQRWSNNRYFTPIYGSNMTVMIVPDNMQIGSDDVKQLVCHGGRINTGVIVASEIQTIKWDRINKLMMIIEYIFCTDSTIVKNIHPNTTTSFLLVGKNEYGVCSYRYIKCTPTKCEEEISMSNKSEGDVLTVTTNFKVSIDTGWKLIE